MSEPPVFFVTYEEEMTHDDREALSRPGSTGAFRGDEIPRFRWRQ
jgi:hypothetical protein